MNKLQLAALTAAALMGTSTLMACGQRQEDSNTDSSHDDGGVVEDIVTDVEDGVRDIVTEAGDVIEDLVDGDDSSRASDTTR